uniref:C10 family peptidase n=1 Tax=Citrobacter braakii TaxID=57706 RepID=UPI001BCBD8A2
GLAIDQIAQSGLSSLSVIYYSAHLFSSQLDFLEEISALVDNFSYEDDISYISYKETNNFTDYIQQSTINDAVIENLQMGFPVLVDIPGHSTVCDGYMGDGVFSFNYGWGGGQ